MLKREHGNCDILQFNYAKKAKSFFSKHEDLRNEFEDDIHAYYCRGQREGIDIRKMSGSRQWIRMKLQKDYRVIYCIVKQHIVVVNVLLAGARGEVYRQYDKR